MQLVKRFLSWIHKLTAPYQEQPKQVEQTEPLPSVEDKPKKERRYSQKSQPAKPKSQSSTKNVPQSRPNSAKSKPKSGQSNTSQR